MVLGNTRAAQDSGYEVCNGRLRNVAAEKAAQRERDASRLIELGAERQRAIELLERYGSLQAAANAFCTAADASTPSDVRRWVEQLRSGRGGQKEQAAFALGNLAFNNTDNPAAIARAGGIAPLAALARGGTDGRSRRPRRRCVASLPTPTTRWRSLGQAASRRWWRWTGRRRRPQRRYGDGARRAAATAAATAAAAAAAAALTETSGSFGPDYLHNGGRPTSSHANQKDKNI